MDATLVASTFGYSAIRAGRLERLLVVRFGSFGDMVLMTPMLRRLRQRFGATIDVLGTGHWTEALLKHDPGIGYAVRRSRARNAAQLGESRRDRPARAAVPA
jgi:ADP-heptose:LPS heptosyltransferase